jgi:hypothetical protein
MLRFCAPPLLAALLVCLAVPASGQTSFGAKVGANISTWGGSDADRLGLGDAGSRTGLVIGGLINHRLSPLLAFQPELLYSQKGPKYSEQFMGQTLEATVKLDYVEVPLLLMVNVPVGSPQLRPTLHVGPTLAYEVGCKVSFSFFGESETEDCDSEPDFDDDVAPADRRKFDLGLGLGGGLDVDFRGGILTFEGRYTMGLRTLDTSSDPWDVKNRAFSLTFGYRMR